VSAVWPSVRLSPISQPLKHLESWNFKHKSVHLQWSIVWSGILDPWPGNPGIWPWPGPLPKKIQFYKHNSYYQNWTYDGSFERSQRKDQFQFETHGHLCLWLTRNPAKVPKFKYTAWWYSFDQEFYADVEKTYAPQFGTSMLHGFNGHDPAKVPKYMYATMVLFRSENWYWIRPIY
jgi:hypothetical protein